MPGPLTGAVPEIMKRLLLVLLILLPGAARAGVQVEGDLRAWHRVTLTLDGPAASERSTGPNPFTDYRLTVTFRHESGSPEYRVPGYFAADGRAAETSAEEGSQWRAHLCPDREGRWSYVVSMVQGPGAAVGEGSPAPVEGVDGLSGSFQVAPAPQRGIRSRGRLQTVGARYLRYAGSGEWFLKAGADSPETFLAYADFDGTQPGRVRPPREGEAHPLPQLKTWQPHVRDWRKGDPAWQGKKGRGIIGAVNYLASRGINALSFLTYNAGGDGDNVWPFVARDDRLHYDCSKLDQWEIVFHHATNRGLFLHFKLQETENDDNRPGHDRGKTAEVDAALDGGDLGIERKLYLREIIARFSHHLALNWNLGEENTQTPEQQRLMADYIRELDPYGHLRVIHTYPDRQEEVYQPLLGEKSSLTGASLQNGWRQAHQRTLHWVRASQASGRPWVVCNDEQNPASHGVPPDPGYQGHDGIARLADGDYTLHDIRRHTLWGTLMAGGAGVEYYFGYRMPENDLLCQDYRSRHRSWHYCHLALDLFRREKIPFWEMENADGLVGNGAHDNSRYCFAKAGEIYLVYLPQGGSTQLDLSGTSGGFSVRWYDPRRGGRPKAGSVPEVKAGGPAALGDPPHDSAEDWLVIVRRHPAGPAADGAFHPERVRERMTGPGF